jgi:hypothetical protein
LIVSKKVTFEFKGLKNDSELEEFYYRNTADSKLLLIINHENQFAYHLPISTYPCPGSTYFSHMQRRDYWNYVEEHPAHHTQKRLDKIVGDGFPEAID